MTTNWILRGCPVSAGELHTLAAELSLPIPLAQVLAVRGILSINEARSWLNTGFSDLHQPSFMQDMDRGTDFILQAIAEHKKIAVYGDYDVDGITATTILYKTLQNLGAEPIYYIPQRETEGYGLNCQAIQKLVENGVGLLLTCDNGIAAREQVVFAKELGLIVVITDHHEVPYVRNSEGVAEYVLPEADAIINPKRPDCSYPFKQICAGMIAYKIAQYIYARTGMDWSRDGEEFMQLAAIATVCDIMDLTEENRILVANALPLLKNCTNLGIQSLLAANALNDKEIDVYHIGFILGPCINASGRMGLADTAVELLLTQDEAQAKQLAQKLVDFNTARKEMTSLGVDVALEVIATQGLSLDKVLVVYDDHLPESVGGIIAGRLKEIFHRPVFVLAGGKEPVRGSGRSVPGYNMFESLQETQDLLIAFGGHPMAAGLSIEKENVAALRCFLNEHCTQTLEEMMPQTMIDMQLPLHCLDLDLAKAQRALEPFGKGNPIPVFADKKVPLTHVQLLGARKQVVRAIFELRDGSTLQTVMFRQKDRFEEMICQEYGDQVWQQLLQGKGRISLDILYNIAVNHYNNRDYLQVQIQDFRISSES